MAKSHKGQGSSEVFPGAVIKSRFSAHIRFSFGSHRPFKTLFGFNNLTDLTFQGGIIIFAATPPKNCCGLFGAFGTHRRRKQNDLESLKEKNQRMVQRLFVGR
jgi:hypothetical protein